MTEPLFRLTAHGARAVLRDWVPAPAGEPPLGEGMVEPAHVEWTPERVRARAERLLSELPPRDSGLDAHLAVELYEALAIGRALARDPQLWRWLAVGPLRRWMLHRWPLVGEGGPRQGRVDRYLGPVRAHGLARLWWAAELTVSREGYRDTLRLVGNPYLLDRVLGSGVARTPHVLGGLVDAVEDADWERVNRAVKALGTRAATVCLEALERTEVAAIAREGAG